MRLILTIIIITIFSGSIYAERMLYQFGQDNQKWQNMLPLENTKYHTGNDGTYDVVLQDNEYTFSNKPELLIHFNGKNNQAWDEFRKKGQNYILKESSLLFDSKVKVFGESAGKFSHPNSKLVLSPVGSSWFNKTNHAGSFTIEFWLLPSLLSDDETIFKKYGPIIENGSVTKYSGIICKIMNRKLQWEFHHLFNKLSFSNNNDTSVNKIEITSPKRLKTNQWSHHALTFDALTGKMTYYINGKEVKAIFATTSSQPDDTILTPKFYPQEKSLLTVGEGYYGYIDEFMISRVCKQPLPKLILQEASNNNKARYFFNINPYTASEGSIKSNVIDLGQTGSYLNRINIRSEQPNGSSIILQYRMRDQYFPHYLNDKFFPWKTFSRLGNNCAPNNKMNLKKMTGRYFQWRAILRGGQKGKSSPTLKDVSFQFEIDSNPSPPKNLVAFSCEGKVYLKWDGNVEKDVKGYKIYYGLYSQNYLGDKNLFNVKPIEVGINELSDRIKPVYIVPNLKPNQVYFFVVKAVDQNNHESDESNEVWVRVER